MKHTRTRLDTNSLADGIFSGDRVILGQAITLIESNLESDQQSAASLLEKVLPKTGNSLRIGVTGVPGVGKSTFIESFGKYLVNIGKKLAVLTIDPSSPLTKGSILGDKTRMEELSKHPSAFVRPSSSATATGGVAYKTREVMFLCEAAGYDVIIIETVGVGQSETAVHSMVDFFLLLLLAGAGDELQGIKKGIMEMADGLAITKADGGNIIKAKQARAEYQHALHLFPPAPSGWHPEVVLCSALENIGIDAIWQMIQSYLNLTHHNNYFARHRQEQNLNWLHQTIRYALEDRFFFFF